MIKFQFKHYFFLLLIVTPINCKTKKRRENTQQVKKNSTPQKKSSLGKSSPMPSYEETKVKEIDPKTDIDPSQLFITRLSISKTKFNNTLMGRVMFGVTGDIDYVKWEACRNDNSSKCIAGQTTTNTFLLKTEDEGSYTIAVYPCIDKNKLEKDKENCNTPEQKTWYQAESQKDQSYYLRKELYKLEYYFENISTNFFSIIDNSKDNLEKIDILLPYVSEGTIPSTSIK